MKKVANTGLGGTEIDALLRVAKVTFR